jgi:hypothetical protein
VETVKNSDRMVEINNKEQQVFYQIVKESEEEYQSLAMSDFLYVLKG